MSARAAAAEATRARLLDAAIDRFAADGVGVSFDVIAADVGVTKGALYHHFGSKEGLVKAVYREVIRRHADRVVAACSEGDGRTRLLALIDVSARLYLSGTPFYRLLSHMHTLAATSRPELADIARKMQANQRRFMTELVRMGQQDGSIRPDLDAEAVGLTVNATLMGLIAQQLDPPTEQRRWVAKFRALMEDLL